MCGLQRIVDLQLRHLSLQILVRLHVRLIGPFQSRDLLIEFIDLVASVLQLQPQSLRFGTAFVIMK
jgi:hypothetical protein